MNKYLILAEKPSLMREILLIYEQIKASLPFEADFASFRGHIVRLAQPNEYEDKPEWQEAWSYENLPIIPGIFKLVISDTTCYNNILSMVKKENYDCVVNACDPDREGQLIFHLFMAKARISLPQKRFWTNDLTMKAISNALQNLQDNKAAVFRNLTSASILRSQFDWLVGMNMSRACSISMGTTVHIGRVKTPTLGILVKREQEISSYNPHKTYGLVSTYKEGFKARLLKEGSAAYYDTLQEVKDIENRLGDKAVIKEIKKERVVTYAPALFKLSELQIESSRCFGLQADTTLAICQFLYEQKILTYPRTDCPFISGEAAKNISGMISAIGSVEDLKTSVTQIKPEGITAAVQNKKYVNDMELQKSGHSAIVPTGNPVDFSILDQALISFNKSHNTKLLHDQVKSIIATVFKRVLAIFFPPKEEEKTSIRLENNGLEFLASGNVLLQAGYTVLYDIDHQDKLLPDLQEGKSVHIEKNEIEEKVSKCPERFTDGTLIMAMEHPEKYLQEGREELKEILARKKGIGTSATRAGIIQELIAGGYVERVKGSGKTEKLKATDRGVQVICSLEGKEVVSVDMTGKWEQQLSLIESGELSFQGFRNKMDDFICRSVEDLKKSPIQKFQKESLGKCPLCGGDIVEGKTNYYCSNYKTQQCRFTLWKEDKYLGKYYKVKKVTPAMVRQVLNNGTLKAAANVLLKPVFKDGFMAWERVKK